MSKSKILGTLRLQQLKDLARAYGLEVDQNGTRETVLPVMEAAEMRGLFTGPPKNPYYYERARFNADQVKEARASGGYLNDGRPVTVLFPWRGPDPEGDIKEKQAERRSEEINHEFKEANRKKQSEFADLRREASLLGINTWGKKKEWLREQIAIAKGAKAPE